MKIAVIRLKGKFSVSPDVQRTLESLRLDRLYSCTLLEEGEASKGMLQACKDVVSFGQATGEAIGILLSRRGRSLDGKRLQDVKKPEELAKLSSELSSSGKKLQDFGVMPVFFLSPPKKGFGDRKSHAPFGPVGKNLKISELIARMA